MRNLVTALFEHERIETTVAKAKEARRVAERMITHAKKDSLHARRLVARVVQDEDVAKKLFDTITPWYEERQGGYTRILKTRKRLGDGGEMAILELVKTTEQKTAERQAREKAAEEKAAAAEEKPKRKKAKKADEAAKETEEKPEEKVEEEAPKTREKPKRPTDRVKKKGDEKGRGGLLGKFRRRKTGDG
jgi:large subunit ribosomal protein L17